MAERKWLDPRKQFSKRLARWTAVFWFLYMTWLSVIMLLEPAAALFCVYMGIMVTVVMIFMTVAYTRNSIAEKLVLAMLDKTKLELSLNAGNSKKSSGGSGFHFSEEGEDDDEESDGLTEEGENG